MPSERIIAYVDGFNLYFGLKDSGWKCYYWLNIFTVCHKLLIDHQHLVLVKYFTSRIKSPEDKKKRQSTYLEALNTLAGIKLYYGIYQTTPIICDECGFQNDVPEEKMTDVQIASEMIVDAYNNRFDKAFLISGDRDLVPAIEKIRTTPPNKKVIAVFPPKRLNADLRGAANGYLHLTEEILKNSLLPSEITKTDGYVLRCPSSWQ